MLVVTHEMQFAHDIAEDHPPSQVVDDPQTTVAREFFARLRNAKH